MRNTFSIAIAGLMLLAFAGCVPSNLLTVDFEPQTELQYKIVSQRDIELQLTGTSDSKNKKKSQKMIEKMELVIVYIPTGAEDEYGRTIVTATVKSAKVTRKAFTNRSTPTDAVQSLAGKSFTIPLSATGQIDDYSDLNRILGELGQKALVSGKGSTKVRNPDMIADFAASQWYFWDSVSKITNPRRGVEIGQVWSTEQLAPMPLPLNIVKQTDYTLTDLTDVNGEQIANIEITISESDETVEHWDDPYGVKYSMKGMFAFLRGYQLLSLEGSGKQQFNVDKGVVLKEDQQYSMVFNVSFPMALGDVQPKLKIDQKFSVELLD